MSILTGTKDLNSNSCISDCGMCSVLRMKLLKCLCLIQKHLPAIENQSAAGVLALKGISSSTSTLTHSVALKDGTGLLEQGKQPKPPIIRKPQNHTLVEFKGCFAV